MPLPGPALPAALYSCWLEREQDVGARDATWEATC